MAAEKIGTYHLADNPEKFEVARSNNFEFVIQFDGVDPVTKKPRENDPLLRAGITRDRTNAQPEDKIELEDAKESIRLSVVKASVPHFTQEEIVVTRGNDKMYAAGVPTFGDGTLEVNDFIGAQSKSVLLAWQKLSYDARTEKVGRMKDYKRDCLLMEYTPDYELVRTWELKGCWVKGISEPEYSMEDNSKRTITATIRYDKAFPVIGDEIKPAE